MTRRYVDCREMPYESRCTVAISADDETELLEAALDHAVSMHGYRKNDDIRAMLRQAMHQGSAV
jgi:predicted small metal-binding protein